MPISSMRVTRSQGEDVDVVISGSLAALEDPIEIVVFDPKDHDPSVTARVMRTVFSLESKLLALLYWERENEHDLILPLEGRGMLDFTGYSGLQNPKNAGWTGRIMLRVTMQELSGSPIRHFALALDLSKQRN